MSRIPRAPLIGLGLFGLTVVALLVLGQGGAKPAAAQPLAPVYKCYNITGPAVNLHVKLLTQFGLHPDVVVGKPSLLCLPAGIGEPYPGDVPHLKCYDIVADYAGKTVDLLTRFGVESNVAVGKAMELCVPANKAFPPDVPPPPPLTEAHYECYDIDGAPLGATLPAVLTQFGVEEGVVVTEPARLCAPALKNGEGDLTATHLKCYNIMGPALAPEVVNLATQFGVELNVPVGGPPARLCVPALKEVVGPGAVGGIAEGPGLAGTSGEEAGTPAESSGWSSAGYAALAGGLAAAVVALSAGAWYARRRSLR
jgi:hypothetical protein